MQTQRPLTTERRVPPILTDGHAPSLGRVLLAGMNPVVAAALKERLTQSGYVTTYMPSGTEARWSLFSTRYEALVVSLDDADGCGLDLMRDVSKHRRLPQVFALAGGDRAGVEEAKEFGATCILEGQSGLEETANAVCRLLD